MKKELSAKDRLARKRAAIKSANTRRSRAEEQANESIERLEKEENALETEAGLADGTCTLCHDCHEPVCHWYKWQSFRVKDGVREFYNANWEINDDDTSGKPPKIVVCGDCVIEYRGLRGKQEVMENLMGGVFVDCEVDGYGEPYSSQYHPNIVSLTIQKDGKRVTLDASEFGLALYRPHGGGMVFDEEGGGMR